MTVNAGTLNVSDATALGTGALTMNGGTLDNTSGGPMTLATNNVQNWNGDFTFTGTNSLDVGTGAVNLGGSGSRTITVSANTLAAGEVRSGTTQGLIKQGAGTLAFTSTGVGNAGSLLGGTLEVASGTVQINRTGDVVAGDFTATGLTGNGTIINGAAIERWLIINMTGTQTFSGTLANGDVGALGLSKQSNGTLILTGASSYTGTTTVGGGILNVQNSDALGMSTLVNQAAGNRNSGIQLQGNISLPGSVNFRLSNDGGLQGPATVAYAIDNVSGNNTINGTITLTSGGGNSVIQSDSGALTLAGTVTSDQTRTLILQGASTDANTVSGAISNGTAGINSVSKSGVGTWTLSGANGYTGMTTVSNGTLTINSANSGAGTNVTLNGGSSLVLGNTQALGAASLINLTPAGTATLTYATDGGDTAYQLSMSSGSTFNIVLNRATADSTVTHNLSTAAGLSGFGSGTVSFTKGSNVTTLATASFDQFNLGGGGGGNTVISPGPGTNVIIGTATKSNNNVSQTLELGGVTTDNEITGEISNGLATGANSISLTKSDTGTWTLSGASTYTGPTNVNNGTLIVSGTINGSSAVNVNGGALVFSASQTLNELNIADGAVAILGSSPAPTFAAETLADPGVGAEAPAFDESGAVSSFAGSSLGAAVPEPGVVGLFFAGAFSLLVRRRRQST
ncbi:MAG TPA: autotransporter-associated beta strand repeat-containing protein [Chthoniobacteraceae bacterium]|nr:autotransporter-associated beta strand repeat-containing protein [Chthoniobacteraceae bacterium]